MELSELMADLSRGRGRDWGEWGEEPLVSAHPSSPELGIGLGRAGFSLG